MNDRHHHRTPEPGSNGATSSGAAVEPEIVADPPTGHAYPYQHPIPPGHLLVRREVAWAIGGAIVGGVLAYLLFCKLSDR